jgi:hypothetical protein
LRQSEAKYRGFIENLSVMFYAAEPRPPYSPIYISPAFKQFGYPLEEWRDNPDLWDARRPPGRPRLGFEKNRSGDAGGRRN